jgi:hypothetical protein
MGTEPSNQGRKWTDFWRELLQCVSEEEIRHGVSRVVGVRWLPEHDALLFRVCLLRSTLRLPYDVVPRVRDVPPLCDDALLLFLTSVSSHRLPWKQPSAPQQLLDWHSHFDLATEAPTTPTASGDSKARNKDGRWDDWYRLNPPNPDDIAPSRRRSRILEIVKSARCPKLHSIVEVILASVDLSYDHFTGERFSAGTLLSPTSTRKTRIPVTEERKYAILFAATLLCARKLAELDSVRRVRQRFCWLVQSKRGGYVRNVETD